MHKHWTVMAYEKELDNPSGVGMLLDGIVEVLVDAPTEDEALLLAKETIERPFYRVSKVHNCGRDHDIDRDLQMLQLKLMKSHLK